MSRTIPQALTAAVAATVITFTGLAGAVGAETRDPAPAHSRDLAPESAGYVEGHTMGPSEEIVAAFDRINALRAAKGLAPMSYDITIADGAWKSLNASMLGRSADRWYPPKGAPLGSLSSWVSGVTSDKPARAGVQDALDNLAPERVDELTQPRFTHVGIAVAHPSNPGPIEGTEWDVPATQVNFHFFGYPPGTTLPGSYQDAGDAYAGYTAPVVSPFPDVAPGQQFYKEMAWLAETGISTGWAEADGSRTYRALSPVNRDAMAAFLYRWNGSPSYADPAASQFRDVPPGTQFYREISWLSAAGVSTGWSVPVTSPPWRVYKPLQPITRDAMAAFLYRMAGRPAYTAPAVSPFADVSTDRLFYKEMAWLAEEGISTGWDNGDGTRSYRPDAAVNRDAMAAFLYRTARVK